MSALSAGASWSDERLHAPWCASMALVDTIIASFAPQVVDDSNPKHTLGSCHVSSEARSLRLLCCMRRSGGHVHLGAWALCLARHVHSCAWTRALAWHTSCGEALWLQLLAGSRSHGPVVRTGAGSFPAGRVKSTSLGGVALSLRMPVRSSFARGSHGYRSFAPQEVGHQPVTVFKLTRSAMRGL